MQYVVSFETCGFTKLKKLARVELSAKVLKDLTAKCKAEGILPVEASCIHEAYVSSDKDDYMDGELRLFFHVGLLVEAENEEDAEIETPYQLLKTVASPLLDEAAKKGAAKIDLESSWELFAVDNE